MTFRARASLQTLLGIASRRFRISGHSGRPPAYATPEQRAFWSEMWAERIMQPGVGADGWFAIVHGEILCAA